MIKPTHLHGCWGPIRDPVLGSWSWAALSSGAWDVHDRGAGWCGDNPRKPLMGKNEVMPQSSVARPRRGICATVGGTRETEAFIFYTFDVPTRLICGRHPHDRPVSRPEHPLDDEDVSNTSTECMQEFTHLLGKLNFLLGIPTLSFAQKRWLEHVARCPDSRPRGSEGGQDGCARTRAVPPSHHRRPWRRFR